MTALIDEALAIIQSACDDPRQAVVAYSGGKDGLAVALLAKWLGIGHGVCDESYYFTRQREDVRVTADSLGIYVAFREYLRLDYLVRHPEFVFPQTTQDANRFMQARQRTTVEKYAKAHGCRVILTGRKRQGGNSIKAPFYQVRSFTSCHPLIHWSDQNVWDFLAANGVPKPWIYSTALGRAEGNIGWPLAGKNIPYGECWHHVWDVEPDIVIEAARESVVGAKAFLGQL